eukprot:TRINITY_DN727_c0_g1_i1.p1 TRINITY_DN727_c0_g1~~TRINITY_DN727_c0_g1_i1.p1  ORF type:complete len:714 (+),score=72.58 TRINITY_DN727_c0_g1_i1:157-2298(+)
MGINGLLPVIKPICKQEHVQVFANSRVGVDAYAWLHKGAFSCASKICTGVETNAYVEYCMYRVRMLIHFGAQPVLVFDGAELPMKARTHAERRERREEALGKAEQAVAAGESRRAEEWYQRAFCVTSDMARNVIRECRKLNVEYFVAPYEADAQLAWMMQTGYIESVITEDSDLLVYGATKIFYKMSKDGMGDMFESKNLSSLEAISMGNFTEDMFMYMCVCSGCDFFKGVQGLGIKKAHTLIKRYKTLPRLLQAIRREPRYKASPTLTADFARACMVFRHQTVYDVDRQVHTHLRDVNAQITSKLPHGILKDLEDGSLDLTFLGVHREPNIARKIAEGLLHPRTLKEYDEPLDIVPRPVVTKRRPRRFASPPPKRMRLTSQPPKSVRGFQVQPASSRPQTPSASARTQIERPSTSSFSFNPRRIGIAFRAQTKAGLSTSRVWSNFRPSSRIENNVMSADRDQSEDGDNQKGKPPIAEEDQSCSSETEDFVNVGDDRNDTQTRLSLSLDVDAKQDEPELPDVTNETTGPGRPRSSSHRVEAVNRALGKFARTKERDVRNKFKAHEKEPPRSCPSTPPKSSPANPPSPDANTYKLFALAESAIGRENSGEELANAKVTHQSYLRSEASKKSSKCSASASGKQMRLSRFFKPAVPSNEGKQCRPSSESLIAKSLAAKSLELGSKSSKTSSKKKRSQVSNIDMSVMDRFKRKPAKK